MGAQEGGAGRCMRVAGPGRARINDLRVLGMLGLRGKSRLLWQVCDGSHPSQHLTNDPLGQCQCGRVGEGGEPPALQG